MNAAGDQHCFSRKFSTDNRSRKHDIPIRKGDIPLIFFAAADGHITKLEGLLCAFFRAHQKHRCRCIVQSLFLAPDALPDFGIGLDGTDAEGFEHLRIPRRPFHRRERHLARNVFHAVNVRAQIMVVELLLFHFLPVCLVRFFFLLVIEITVPVRIKIEQHAARFQDTHPLLVCLLRLFQIPGQISGNDNIKGLIRKLQILCIHPLQRHALQTVFRIFSQILFRLFQHLLRIVNSRHRITCLRQNHREESRAGSDIENLHLFFLFLWKLLL